jgi:hypothetical protein
MLDGYCVAVGGVTLETQNLVQKAKMVPPPMI